MQNVADNQPLPTPSDRERAAFDDFTPFWDAYNVEAEEYDKELIREWASDLDALLIFAGLFAGVNTAFIIESYKTLQEDQGETNNLLLKNILHRMDNSTFVTQNLQFTDFQASGESVRVNCFFFASLSLSLFAAFGAVLSKQWLSQYEGGSTRAQRPAVKAITRHQKLQGLQRWYLRPIVETLPTLLQLSLFLFLIGLVDFLWQIHKSVAIMVLAISITIFAFYSFTTIVSIAAPTAPFQTRFSSSSREVLNRILHPRHRFADGKDAIPDDPGLRKECVSWMLDTATLPSTVRTVCKAIAMLPSVRSNNNNVEDLHDWNVVIRYFRTIITSGVVSMEVQKGTLPSALEVLYQLIHTSTTPLTARDSTLISNELALVLPGRLYEEPASGKWILKILGIITAIDPKGFYAMISSLYPAVAKLEPRSGETEIGGIADQFLLLLGKAVELKQLDTALKITDLLNRAVDGGTSGLELEEEETIRIFPTLLEGSFDKRITPVDRTALLSLSSTLIRRTIHYRVEKLGHNSQSTSLITPSAAGINERLPTTLRVLWKLLKDHNLDTRNWEDDLLALFRSSLIKDMETNIAIIQILALLTPTLPPNKFDERDVKAFEAFLAQSSAMSSSTEWISAAMLVLFCASKSDATGVADFLRTSTIPEATLQNLFLTGVSDSETKFQTNARWEMCGKWLASKGESMHVHFQENGWSKKLLEYGLKGSDSDVYLKVVKDLLSCEPHLWYGQLVKDGHLEALVRIMSACDDDKNSDWMACFSFIALWRWYQHEATKCATDEVPPFLDHDIVDGVVHYFISSQRGITEWNVQHFGSHLDDIIIFRDLVLSGSTFLQTAASLGLTPEDQAQALSDGYKRWVSLIMDYLSRIKTAKEDFQLWRWANGHDGLFLTLDHALNGSDGTMQDIGDGALSHNIATSPSVTYVIRCAWSGGLLHCSNDSDHLVVNFKDLGTTEQKWKLIPTSPTAFMLQNVATNTYLSYLKSLPDAPRQLGDGTQYITSVGVAPDRGAHLCCHEIPSEWEFKKAESGDEVRLALHNFPNLMVILWGDYAYDGSSMQLWGFEDKDAQLFTFEEVTS